MKIYYNQYFALDDNSRLSGGNELHRVREFGNISNQILLLLRIHIIY